MSYKPVARNHTVKANQLTHPHVANGTSFRLSSIMLAFYVFTMVAWSQVSEESANYSRLMGLALISVFAAEYLLHRGEKLQFPKGIGLLSLFVLWNATSLFWAQDTAPATKTITTLFQLLVFSTIATNVLILRCSLLPAIVGFLGGVLYAIIRAVQTNNYSLTQASEARFGSVLINANLYAIVLTIGILLILYLK